MNFLGDILPYWFTSFWGRYFGDFETLLLIVFILLIPCVIYLFRRLKGRKKKEGSENSGSENRSKIDYDEEESASQYRQEALEKLNEDPFRYAQHIQGDVKRIRQDFTRKTVEAELSKEEKREEREIQRRQLEQIFSLIKDKEDKFGAASMDDMQDQLKFYGL